MKLVNFTWHMVLVLVVALTLQTDVYAQPTLSADNFPAIGDNFERSVADPTGFDPGPSGPAVTWDFSGLSLTGGGNTGNYVEVGTTPNGDSFSSANVAHDLGGNNYDYYTTSATQTEWSGVDNAGTVITYDDNAIEMVYPFTYGDAFVDTAHRSYDAGVIVGSRITRSVSADGYGTLILPGGITYDNVLRVRTDEAFRDTTDNPAAYLYRETTIYQWFTADEAYPILSYEVGTFDNSGTPGSINTLDYKYVALAADEYGYTQTHSDDGLECAEWIDITGTGQLVLGLADDNFVGPIDMGIDFQYYWTTVSEMYVGSNGYLAFDPIQISSNAIGFPNIPTPDEQNFYVAPLLSDLTFAGVNNPGKVYTYSDAEKLIVTFETVPFWTNNANQYSEETNTFQVIFSTADSSITVNYQQMATAVAAEYLDAANPVVVGIENISGDIGLEYSNTAIPASFSCLQYNPPLIPLIDIIDVYPQWNQNTRNGGFFAMVNTVEFLSTSIKNVGSVDITTPINVVSNVTDNAGFSYVENETTLTDGLTVGQSEIIDFAIPFATIETGVFTYNVQATTSGDANLGNDNTNVELVVVDSLATGEIVLSYMQEDLANAGGVSWTGAAGFDDGAGMYVEPPIYPVEVLAAEYFIAATDGGGFRGQILDDNGLANGPGMELASGDVVGTDVLASAWNRVEFDTPVIIEEGGFYVSWLMEGAGIQLATDLMPPYSRQSYEILASTWAPYRSGDESDLYIRVIVRSANIDGIADNTLAGLELSNALPNPADNNVAINFTLPSTGDVNFTMHNTVGKEVATNVLNNAPAGEHSVRINTSKLPAGIYVYTLNFNGYTISKQLAVTH